MRVLGFSPVFNQAAELPVLLRELAEVDLACDEFLLVNNGSSDGSERLIHESGWPYLEVAANRGVGWAIIAAAEWGLERGFDALVGLAANGKMLPAEMHRVVDPIRAGEADYVTGSRYLPGGSSPNLPAFRNRTIPLMNGLVRLLTGARVTDATCGYRAYRLDILERARFDWRSPALWTYGFEYYLYAKVLLDGTLRWREVPITMRYPPRGRAYSKIRAGRDHWAMIKPWLQARLDRQGFDAAPALGAPGAGRPVEPRAPRL